MLVFIQLDSNSSNHLQRPTHRSFQHLQIYLVLEHQPIHPFLTLRHSPSFDLSTLLQRLSVARLREELIGFISLRDGEGKWEVWRWIARGGSDGI